MNMKANIHPQIAPISADSETGKHLRESVKSADIASQLGLFAEDRTIAQRFAEWKATPGGAQILNRAYRIAAGFVPRFKRTGQQVSMDFIWHTLRYRIAGIKRELKRRGIALERERGFALNNDFTAYVARHMVSRRPEWEGLFEIRECGKAKDKCRRRIIVIEEKRNIERPTLNTERRSGGGSVLRTAVDAPGTVALPGQALNSQHQILSTI